MRSFTIFMLEQPHNVGLRTPMIVVVNNRPIHWVVETILFPKLPDVTIDDVVIPSVFL